MVEQPTSLRPMARRHDPEVVEQRRRTSARQRKAFMEFVAARGLKLGSWAKDAGLPNANALYNYKNGLTDFLSQETLDTLARAIPGASVGEIIGETPSRSAKLRLLPCRAVAQAGVWRQTYEHPDLSRDMEFPLPEGISADELIRLADRHIDQIYPAQSYLAVQAIASMPRPLQPGDKVLVHRIRAGAHEVTIRELAATPTGVSMFFRSSEARHGATIAVPWPYDGGLFDADGDRYQIRGRVVMQTWLEDDD